MKIPKWAQKYGAVIHGRFDVDGKTVIHVVFPIGGGDVSRAYEVRGGRWHFVGEW